KTDWRSDAGSLFIPPPILRDAAQAGVETDPKYNYMQDHQKGPHRREARPLLPRAPRGRLDTPPPPPPPPPAPEKPAPPSGSATPSPSAPPAAAPPDTGAPAAPPTAPQGKP